MNSAQHAALELLANMAKPDVAEAERTLELSKSLELPPRVTGEIEEYIEKAREAGNLATEAKRANDRATKCWQAVKEQAGRSDDLVDMAESASGRSEAATAEAPNDSLESAHEETADPIVELINATVPAAAPFFCRAWCDMEEITEFLGKAPTASNDASVCSLLVLMQASMELVKHGMVDTTARMIVGVLDEYLAGCDPRDPESPKNTELLKSGMKQWKLDAKTVLAAVAPSILDLLQGLLPIDKANQSDLRLAFRCWAYWDSSLASASHGAAIASELERRQPKGGRKGAKSQSKAQEKELLRGLERAAQEGRRNWNLEGKHATSYNKPTYREAYERGWGDCQRAYDQGKGAACSGEDYPGINPYADCDEDQAMASAYDLGWQHGSESLNDDAEDNEEDSHNGDAE